MWAGRNTRVPQQLFYPRRSHFSSYPVRKRWADLTIGEKAQMGYLGWKEASGVVGAWPERRFATIFIGDIMNDVYLPNVYIYFFFNLPHQKMNCSYFNKFIYSFKRIQ